MIYELSTSKRRPQGTYMEPIKNEPRPAPRLPAEVQTASKALEILQRLQTTLETEGVLALFAAGVEEMVSLDGMSFHHEEAAIDFRSGRQSRHSAAYQLNVDQESLGGITFYRGRKFRDAELEILEGLISVLIYPLRNALSYRQAVQSSRRDALTGLNNRVSMDEHIQREIQIAQRHGTPLTMLVVDADHFKSINDTHGHAVGDEILRQIARILQSAIRETDLAFRYGGEEFVVLLNNTDVEGAMIVAERIRLAVNGATYRPGGGTPLTPSVSIGVSRLAEGDTGLSLFDRADRAVYDAKCEGRNRICSR